MENVTIVLADEDVDRRIDLKKMLFQDPDMDVVAETDDAEETLEVVIEENPEILFLNFPLGTEETTRSLVEDLAVEAPQTEIVLIADSMEDSEEARKLQRLGVREAMVRPIEADEVLEVVEDVVTIARKQREKLTEMMGDQTVAEQQRPGKLISVFSTKGGVGRSLLATNLACMIRELTNKSVALIDLDLQFGDDAITLDMTPTTTIASLARDCEDKNSVDYDLLERYMHTHEPSGVDLLPAPPRPEEADYVEARETELIIDALKRHYHYVVIDTSSQVTESVIAALEQSDLIMLLLTLELPTIKDGKLMLELIDNLGLEPEKVKVIMNRDMPESEIELQEVEEALEQELLGGLPSEGDLVMPSVNEGRPIVLSHPESQFVTKLDAMTRQAIGEFLDLEDELPEESEAGASGGTVDLPLAPMGSRLVAGAIDFALAFLFGWGAFILLGFLMPTFLGEDTGALIGFMVGALGALVPIGYYSILQAGPQTLGKQIMGLAVTDESGATLSLGTSVLRSVIFFVGVFPFAISQLWMFLNANRQGLHDLLAGSYVVRSETEETYEE
jgi:pilus assembly protein CpaE